MVEHEFRFPDGYEDEAPIVESKGWLVGTLESKTGKRYTLCFCCPERLRQDVEAEFEIQPCYTQRNLVVVPELTRERILEAVDWIVAHDIVSDFVSD